MAAPQTLAKPPIIEALVDFRVARDEALTIDRFHPLRDRLRSSYPTSDEKKHFEAEFRVESGKFLPPATRDLGFNGLWLSSSDGSRIAQFRPDGFTLNNVNTYMGGDALLEEAFRLWAEFVQIAAPAVVLRLALRYLNRLSLPLNLGEDFDRLLTASPGLPPEAQQAFSSFLSRIVAHEDERQVIVTQKLERVLPTGISVVIDIDAALPGEWPPDGPELRPHFDSLRELKNRTFFSLLTPDAVKLFL